MRRLARRRFASFDLARPTLAGGVGLEIGGPSALFSRGNVFPAYPLAERVDNTNFAAATIWEGSIASGRTFRFDADREPGYQHLLDATALTGVADATYDFLLSSHTLEHVANPLKALAEWRRVLRPGGLLVAVLPHRDATFDRRRPVTTLQHLRDDFTAGVSEADLTHLAEVLALHDLSLDPGAKGPDAFAARCRDNATVRGMHHHTFTTETAAALLDEAGFQLVSVEPARPHHVVLLARRPDRGEQRANAAFLAPGAPWRARSPFASDRALVT